MRRVVCAFAGFAIGIVLTLPIALFVPFAWAVEGWRSSR